MTEPVVCHNGKCRYKYQNKDLLKEQTKKDILSQIERDLLHGRYN